MPDSHPAEHLPHEAGAPLPYPWPRLPLAQSMWRGALNRCPICGEGKVFKGFLRVVDRCEVCQAPLGRLRADDAPPYFTIFLVGHLLVPPIFWLERAQEPPFWFYLLVGLPLFAILTTLLLRPVKGATVGLMVRLGLEG
ncbi:DUF983 domain-containing protein [Sabulicella rubraurantiaca]|uniref:DUF983 domain-containing protein n=1 Tax=Sabulicella rubraurantiaca TaxID=2811429 RepID=UPI001F33AEDC|nr:DUF983 domain-containing protein [Sabulicella rubraurantiaca]